MSNRRKRPSGRALLALSAATLVSAAVIPGTSFAEPPKTLEQVRKEVKKLQEGAEHAAELSNEYKDKVRSLERRLRTLNADVERQEENVDKLRARIGAFAAAEYRGGTMDTSTQLLMAKNPDEYLRQMDTAQAVRTQQADAIRHLQAEQKKLEEQKAEQKAQLARLRDARKQAAAHFKSAQAKYKKGQAYLAKLTAEERARIEAQERRASRSGGRDPGGGSPPPVEGSGRGAIALRYANAQLGDGYSFGTEGPSQFDCSGLTMMAWKQAGVSLPHSARQQYNQVPKVTRSQLQPGDLIFYYSDLHHVGVYAGNGRVTHASNPSRGVVNDPMNSMPIAGFGRPG